MIGSLRGVLIDRPSTGEVLVEVGGVGYRASVPASTFAALGALGAEVFLYVHTHVREDAIVLFGFSHPEERRCFEALLGAHGVGPSLALAILSSLSPASLSAAVREDDLDTLCTVPGVGRKTAARLLLELKTRLELPAVGSDHPSQSAVEHSVRGDVRQALRELGYGPDEIRSAFDTLPDGSPESVETTMRQLLRHLARSQ